MKRICLGLVMVAILLLTQVSLCAAGQATAYATVLIIIPERTQTAQANRGAQGSAETPDSAEEPEQEEISLATRN